MAAGTERGAEVSKAATTPRAVLLFTAGLAATAVVAALVNRALFPAAAVDWAWLLPAVALLVAGASLQIRFRYRNDIEALDLFEAALLPVLFAFPGWVVVPAVFVANAIAETIRRNEPVKGAFNAVQWTTASAAGALTYAALRDDHSLTATNLAALSAAMVVVLLVNHLAFAGVLAIVQQHSLPQVLKGLQEIIVPGWLIGGGLNLAFGVLFVAAYDWSPALLPLFFVPLIALNWAGAAYAAARADELRLQALHGASSELSAAVDPMDKVERFLNEARTCFEAEAAELILVDPSGEVIQRVATGATPLSHALTELLLALDEPARLTPQTGQHGWRDCLAAPLFDHAQRIGVLVTYNRSGLEGFEDGELAVLGALADDVVAALQRGRLLQQVMDERSKLRGIVENASDGIFTVDVNGTVLSWNPAFEAVTGYAATEVVGRRDLGVLRPRDADGRDVILERWSEDRDDPPADLQVLTRAGELRWLSCTYSRVTGEDGEVESLIVMARDVTKMRDIERLRDDFVATVSHELRTPLSPIKGWASTLLQFGDKLDETERQTALRSILRQSQRLERLIVNLLEVSKIEHGAGDSEPADVDIASVVERVIADFRAASPHRTFHVDGPGEPVWGHAKELWVEQILTNLVSNAVKYSPDDKPVEVTIEPALDCVRVVVVDSGYGIPSHELDRVFERFHRGRETGTQTGTGLGLYIARHLAKEIGGDVSVQSVLGRGSRFTLEVPVVTRVIDVRRSVEVVDLEAS